MFSKSQFKLITSLAQKKYRTKQQLFFVEGKKTISELLNSQLRLHSLFTTEAVFNTDSEKTFFLKPEELHKISRLHTPQTALAIFEIPEIQEPKITEFTLALDGVRDPGNLGTIIRLCDWFGIKNLICSSDTVDCYNPKVLQATMGSIARVAVYYTPLSEFLKKQENIPFFGAFMDGETVYSQDLPSRGILVMGNEAHGISQEISGLITKRLSIPQFGAQTTESLNVATATAILLSEFRGNS